ncbi:MAG TPA: ATP-dependent Clp protease ATP-binding subunit [Clostridia bacterium]|nr:ATP-dependent Clp protease ATP-binding subunit [Clostridia bacterium]
MVKYTIDLQKVLELAETFSFRSGGMVNSTHILVALASYEHSYAYEILSRLGFTAKIANSYLVSVFVEKESYDIQLNNTRRIFEFAYKVAKIAGYDDIDTQHVLLSICYNKSCSGCKILARHDIDYNIILPIINGMNYNEIGKGSQENNSGNTETNVKDVDELNEILKENGVDLTEKARLHKLDPVIGREKEINRVIQILSRRSKNNPIIVGESGVGKTAVVEGLCQRIVEGKVPEFLLNKTIYSLNVNSLVSGTRYRGEFEDKIKNLLKALENKNIILFIDEMHTIVSAGSSEGGLNLSNILKPALVGRELSTIGATTISEYRKYIEKDPALERRFMMVNIEEPSENDCIKILYGLKDGFEKHHKLKIDDAAIVACVKLSARYISDRFLPDKAIDVLDETCAKKRNNIIAEPDRFASLENDVKVIDNKISKAVMMEDYDLASNLKSKLEKLKKEQSLILNNGRESDTIIITEEDISNTVAEITNIPVQKLTSAETNRLLNIEQELSKRVIGQTEAIALISKAIKRSRAGMKDKNRPVGSFVFLGPTGVGKTETAKALCSYLFGDDNAIIRLDMSEYMEKISASRLIGAPPGYVGYEEGGMLTEAVRRKPYSIVLLDEIEKAHIDVYNMLLQVLDEGRLTDSKGRTVDFKNTIIIMTSNVGASDLIKKNKVGFYETATELSDYEEIKSKQMEALKGIMKPEFINRIDNIIVFNRLSKENIQSIANLLVNRLANTLYQERGIVLELDEAALNFIVEEAYDADYGARPLKRAIQSMLEDKLSEEIIKNNLHDTIIRVTVNKKNLIFSIDKGGQICV